MINGILNIYKEKGFTSHDVVAKLRGIVKQKKIGHTGTLDPDAVGVLPVCLGSATKLCDMLTDKSKEYEAVMQLGITTDTQDISGKILSQTEVCISRKEVEEAVMSFVGGYEQIPPMYSALKVNGKKLYELAREGKEIERKPRHVDILYINIITIELPKVKFIVGCSKGTYIRTLCADIGNRLSCGAAMTDLKRTQVGSFHIKDAITLSQVEELVALNNLSEYVITPDMIFTNYERADISFEYQSALINGNKLYPNQLIFDKNIVFKEKDMLRVYDSNHRFTALYTFIEKEGVFKPYKMFLSE